ncbi:baeRF2 domain-containing protein [Streptomyces lydicus]|uniref:baeRF2 domain-containing protein n=1 Tax=Streptomyces lydicus TaxID=47763 RepID=UPI0036E79269
MVLVAGDPKAVGLLREHLAARQSDAEVVYIEGGRTDDSAREALRASVDAAMHEVMASRHRAVLERLEAELTGGRALQGIPAVKEALAEGRVETLLLAADRGADPVLFASRRDPRALGTDPAALGEDSTAFSASAAPLLLRSESLEAPRSPRSFLRLAARTASPPCCATGTRSSWRGPRRLPFPTSPGSRALPARRVFSAQAEVTRCQSSV